MDWDNKMTKIKLEFSGSVAEKEAVSFWFDSLALFGDNVTAY